MGDEKTCFVVCPIGEPGSQVRKRSDQLLKHIIAPVVEPRGYKTLRADQIAEPGMITPQVIDRVRDSDLVVADLAGRNPNVFYELAIRHAEKKPLIQIMAKGEDIPFDVQDMRTISVDIHDLDSVEEARQELSKQVDAIESGDFQMNTPISVALDLRALRESGDPGQRAVADVLDAIAEVKSLVTGRRDRPGQLYLEKAVDTAITEALASTSPKHLLLKELVERLLREELRVRSRADDDPGATPSGKKEPDQEQL